MKRLGDLSDDELARLARRAEHELPDAPLRLVDTAMAMWRAPSTGRRILATLGFDSWAAQPTLALRSALPMSRQLLFAAQGRDVDLRVSPADPASRQPTRFAVTGQVLGAGQGGTVSLARADNVVATLPLGEFAEFRFADLAPGACVITIRFGDDEIVLPAIDVGGEPPAA